MATLTSTKIKNTYDALLKSIDNDAIGTTAKQITDGLGNLTPLYISTTQIGIGVTPESGLNLHVYGDAKIGSNLTVIGNLVVEGSTTTVGTDTLTVKDPLIVLANNNTSTDAVDIGFYGKYTPSGTTLYSGLFREALTGKYRLFKDLQEEPTTTVNTSGTGYAQATLIAALEGNVTGNVTGNLIGSVTGGTFSGTLLSNVVATTQSAGDNSTKVATTAYVDNQVGLYDTLSEVLANGNTTGGTDIVVSTSDQIFIPYGSATNPSIAFSNDTDNGIYGVTNSLNITVGGTIRASFSPNFIQFRPDGFTRFSVDYNGIFAYLDTEIQGDLIVDTDTLFVDASEDSVGIGLTNPSDYSADELVISVPDDSGMTLVSGTTDTAYIRFADGTAAADQANFISHDHNTNTLTVFSQAKVSIGITEAEVAYFTDTAFYVDKSTTIDDTLTVNGNSTFAGNVSAPSVLANSFMEIRSDTASLYFENAANNNYYRLKRSSNDFVIDYYNGTTTSDRLTIDSSGNVGIGITPYSWSTSFDNIQIGNKISLWSASNNGGLSYNQYYNGTNNIYQTNDTANRFQMDSDGFHFYQAASGTAGNSATFSESMRIDSSGTTTIKTDGTTQLIFNRADSSIFSGNTIGTIQATADDPSAGQVGGQIQFTGADTWSTNYYPTNIIFSNDNSGTLTERMRIDSSGQVIFKGTGNGIDLRFKDISAAISSETAGYIGMSTSAYSGQNGDLVLIPRTSAASNILLMQGNVGIGTDSPDYKVDTLGTNQYALRLNTTDADGCFLTLQTNSVAKSYIGTSYHLLLGTQSADDTTIRAEGNL